MKNTLVLVAVAGLASVAAAQSGSLSMTASGVNIDVDSIASFTLSVWGEANFGTHIAGGGFGLSAVGADGFVTNMTASVPAWGVLGFQDNGHTGGGNYAGVIFGQLIFPPVIAPSAESALGNGPVQIASFSVSVFVNGPRIIDWSVTDIGGDFILEVFDESDSSFTQLTAADIDLGGITVIIFPAPSSVALLGFGGLFAGRRRR